MFKKNSKGFILLEIIVAIALITIAFTALIGVGFLVLNVSNSAQKQTKANLLVEEEFEAVRSFRDGTTWATTGLGVVSAGSSNPYHLVISANKWTPVSGVETSGIYTRKVVFDKVSRDISGNIEATYNSSRDDSDTIKITVTVSWESKSIQDVSYLANWVK